jgi:adenylosuccinate lyase
MTKTAEQGYRSSLETRYASAPMRAIWSEQRRFSTWRRLWLVLAEAQHQLGLRQVTAAAVEQMRRHVDDIDMEAAAAYEKRFRHDVMAHIHAYGDVAPLARPIIHLGATSQFVNCNTELIQIRDSLELIAAKLAGVIDALGRFSQRHRALPTLGLTHYQPAQPTTVGKRSTLWAQDFWLALEEVEHRLATLRFRGVRGATGTQASFLSLFQGDHDKVERLDELVTRAMGFAPHRRFPVTGQTYPRLLDAQVLNALAVAAAAVGKCTTDLRLLAGRREIEEPFEATQVGSSVMPYKRNPMRCERAAGLARFVMNLAPNALQTAVGQWMERTLDDSSNRRLVLPEAFLALDAALDIMHNVAAGLVVRERTIHANLMAELPAMATEEVMLAAVERGGDRQAAHESIRRHSRDAAEAQAAAGGPSDLIDRLRVEPLFRDLDFDALLDPRAYIGRAPQQVDRFVADVVEPVRERYRDRLAPPADLGV